MPIAIYHDNIMPHQKIKKDTFITLLQMGIPSKLDLTYLVPNAVVTLLNSTHLILIIICC